MQETLQTWFQAKSTKEEAARTSRILLQAQPVWAALKAALAATVNSPRRSQPTPLSTFLIEDAPLTMADIMWM